MIAPIAVSVTASTRNCQRIVTRVAPSALRTPISRVRSVTEIIMIATTPTPPTINPTADSTIMTRKNIPKILLYVSNSWSCVMIAKLLSTPGRRPRRARIAAITSSIASSRVTSSRGSDRDSHVADAALQRAVAVSIGTMARGRFPPARKLAS